jgi:hypothetical protein
MRGGHVLSDGRPEPTTPPTGASGVSSSQASGAHCPGCRCGEEYGVPDNGAPVDFNG